MKSERPFSSFPLSWLWKSHPWPFPAKSSGQKAEVFFRSTVNASSDAALYPQPAMPPTPVLFISAALLTAAGMLGGLPAGMLCAIALVAQCTSNCRAGGWGLIGGSLSWLVLAQVTHNRELFFPYTMLLAAVACVQLCGQRLWAGSLAGGAVLAAFFLLRILQKATGRVLLVEFIVAVAILAAVIVVSSQSPRTASIRAAIAVAASLLAYLSLSL